METALSTIGPRAANAAWSEPLDSYFRLHFFHTDHLGSTRVVTDAAGRVYERIDYSPFGEIFRDDVTSGPNDPFERHREKFIGQTWDYSTGLYYYGARYYDPEIGRFTSADTVIPSPLNGQAYNRYSYVINNPYRYVDPSGNNFLEGFVSAIVSVVVFSACIMSGNPALMALAPVLAGMAGGATSGAIAGYKAGGLEGALQGAFLGAVIGGISSAIGGQIFTYVEGVVGTTNAIIISVIASGAVAAAQGGDSLETWGGSLLGLYCTSDLYASKFEQNYKNSLGYLGDAPDSEAPGSIDAAIDKIDAIATAENAIKHNAPTKDPSLRDVVDLLKVANGQHDIRFDREISGRVLFVFGQRASTNGLGQISIFVPPNDPNLDVTLVHEGYHLYILKNYGYFEFSRTPDNPNATGANSPGSPNFAPAYRMETQYATTKDMWDFGNYNEYKYYIPVRRMR